MQYDRCGEDLPCGLQCCSYSRVSRYLLISTCSVLPSRLFPNIFVNKADLLVIRSATVQSAVLVLQRSAN